MRERKRDTERQRDRETERSTYCIINEEKKAKQKRKIIKTTGCGIIEIKQYKK